MRTRALWSLTASAALLSACAGLSVAEPQVRRDPIPAARPGGRIVVGIAAPRSLDPADVSDPGAALITSLVCEPLVQLDPRDGAVVHGIADRVVVTGRGAVLTISLRKGVRFHDGSTLAARDIEYSLARAARHDVAAANADLLAPIAGFGAVRGPLPPTSDTAPTKRRLTGVRAISKTALEIILATPTADFVRALGTPVAAPVPEGLADRGRDFAAFPVCAGPYRMVRPYRTGDATIELHRFDDYYARNDGFAAGGRGYPDVIEFRILPDREAELRELRAGALDLAHLPASGDRTVPPGGRVVTAPLPEVEYVGFPAGADSPVGRGARRLLSRTLDRTRLVEQVFAGGRIPADGFLPPTVPAAASSPCPAVPERTVPPDSGDAEVLARLRSGSVELFVNDDFDNRSLADAVARQWREALGVDIRVVARPWEDYLRAATGPSGIGGAFRMSWSARTPSADEFLAIFDSKQIGRTNLSRYHRRNFDRRLERVVRREADDAVRQAKYRSLAEIVCRDLPLIPVTFGQEEMVVGPRVDAATGTFADRSSGLPLLRELFVRSDAGGGR